MSVSKSKYITPQLVCKKIIPMFSPWILGQIGFPITALESACGEDSETPPACLIWWSLGRESLRKCIFSALLINKKKSVFVMMKIIKTLSN